MNNHINPLSRRGRRVTIALVAAAGVGYAAWQTFRADDELWVSDDEADDPLAPNTVPR